MFELRPYQTDVSHRAFASWQHGNRNVGVVLPTGAGKTVVATYILNEWQGFKLACAHRQELVSQISLAFARMGIPHRIFAPDNVINDIHKIHRLWLGRSYVDMNSSVAVGGVDTIRARVKRKDEITIGFLKQVSVWFMDECHHILRENKWGEVEKWCPNARGLGVTATFLRADGRGLGRSSDGIIDDLIVGPNMRDLIDDGHLCDYAPPICPPTDMKLDNVNISANGDYSQKRLAKAARESHIVGDVVEHYLKFAPNKLGITFATDIETAMDIARAYRDAGVPAECVTGKTPDTLRHQIIRRFRDRELLQLVNVDLFGEGFDLPALEVVSMARPTMSYGLYVQQFGRVLRTMEGKDRGIILDHVNNVRTHGLPDYGKRWSLDAPKKRKKKSVLDATIPVTSCENPNCLKSYRALTKTCPHCGFTKEPANRSGPEFVDGDLVELDAAALAELRKKVEHVDRPAEYAAQGMMKAGMSELAIAGQQKRHRERQQAQAHLRHSMAIWAGIYKAQGDDDSAIRRRFYHTFGTDMMTAQSLGRPDAEKLKQDIDLHMGVGNAELHQTLARTAL